MSRFVLRSLAVCLVALAVTFGASSFVSVSAGCGGTSGPTGCKDEPKPPAAAIPSDVWALISAIRLVVGR